MFGNFIKRMFGGANHLFKRMMLLLEGGDSFHISLRKRAVEYVIEN
jgi:hypothetical protein